MVAKGGLRLEPKEGIPCKMALFFVRCNSLRAGKSMLNMFWATGFEFASSFHHFQQNFSHHHHNRQHHHLHHHYHHHYHHHHLFLRPCSVCRVGPMGTIRAHLSLFPLALNSTSAVCGVET
jgi:hypothetical protein